MKYKYNKQTHSIKGLPEMERPDFSTYDDSTNKTFNWHQKQYSQHLASLPTYPVQGAVDWIDGDEKELDKDFTILEYFDTLLCKQKVAVPIEQPKQSAVDKVLEKSGLTEADANKMIGKIIQSEQPKEAEHIVKARELVEKFILAPSQATVMYYARIPWIDKQLAKQCAIICCEEIQKSSDTGNHYNPGIEFWNNVKNEILKL